jgi:hypothetical protein
MRSVHEGPIEESEENHFGSIVGIPTPMLWAARRVQVDRPEDLAIDEQAEEAMCHPITLEHQAEPREVGDYVFLGEILVCLGCEEGGSYKITARPATPVEEEAFWARFRDDVKSLLFVGSH